MAKPKIRFKGYTDDWEQRKLEDIMDTVTDYVAAGSFEDIRNNVTYLNEPGYAQLVRTVDLKKKFTNNDSIYVDESAFKYLWRVNLNEECIVLPNIGANIGEVYFVEPSGLPYDNNVLGPNAILLKANEDTYFAFTALNNLTFQKQLFENVGSSGQPKFNKTELKSIQLYMPQNEEQEKIGQYFRDLDHLITLHQRKNIYFYEKVTLVWEQRKLGEVLDDMYNGQTPSRKRDEYWNGNIRWLSSGELNRGIVYSSIETITEEGKKSANLRVVPKGTFVMAITGLEASGTRGNCALLGFDTTLNQSCMALFPKQDILISQFLFQWYRMVGEEYGINYTQGTKQQSYNAELIKILPILLPSIDEQKKIASYLNSIDHLITLHQCKCHLLHKLLHNDWEQRKLGEIAFSFEYGLNAAAKEYDGENKYIRITDIDNNTHEFLTYNLTSPDIDLTDAENYKLAEGDILLARTGASVGKSYIYRDSDGLVYYAGFLIRARIREEYDAEFVFQSTLTDKYNKYIAVTSQRSGQPGVNAQEYSEFEIRVPEKEEQTKIGTYFRILDHLITLHQRKCEETKKLKKYMLQKMFPQNGQKVPEIRFSGFTDAWEQRKFSEFVKNVAVRNKAGVELECYAVTNDRGFISQKEAHDAFGYMADADTTAYNIVPPSSFAYNPARINVGSIGYYTGTENVIVSSLYEVFQTADYVDDRFMWHWFKSDHFSKWIERLQEGSVRLYFYYDKLIQCEMKMPSLEEQKKMGAFFDQLDHLITLHQHKCEQLQSMKKFMLQNMFV